QAVSRLRAEVADQLDAAPVENLAPWLVETKHMTEPAAKDLAGYLAAAGGMQLVLHSPYGSRLNRAWGLALRKRFCRKFNFEIQAAATEDNIVLSLTASHSFPLDEVSRYLHSATALDVLVQALLDAPLFAVRWR